MRACASVTFGMVVAASTVAASTLLAACGSERRGGRSAAGAADPRDGIAVTTARAPPPSDAAVTADVRAANAFSFALHARLGRAGGNLCVSGTSARHALGATYLGARGDTATELAMVLGLPNADVAAALGAVEADEWRTAKPLEGDLVVATRLWVDDGVPLGPSFVGLALRYGASAERVPIARDASKARDAMNAWVSQRTAGKILELLGQGALDAHPRMVVTNAAYLKARWAEPFPKADTKDEEFFVSGKTRVMAPTMHVDADLRYAAVDAAKLVELRYDGTPLTMLLVVPEDRAGLSRLEERLSVDALDRWTKALTPRRVTLGMPRFTFATGGALNDGLRELGLRSAFGDGADFGGMTAGNASRAMDAPEAGRLAIGQIVQRTYIAVDEIGTEAAAATGVVMRTTSVDLSSPVPVLADRPFLFLVRDASRGRVLFVGRVDDPR